MARLLPRGDSLAFDDVLGTTGASICGSSLAEGCRGSSSSSSSGGGGGAGATAVEAKLVTTLRRFLLDPHPHILLPALRASLLLLPTLLPPSDASSFCALCPCPLPPQQDATRSPRPSYGRRRPPRTTRSPWALFLLCPSLDRLFLSLPCLRLPLDARDEDGFERGHVDGLCA